MPEKWTLNGEWINTCSCDSGCPCLFYSDPTKGYCDSLDSFHITKGTYGTVKLDGLNVMMLGKIPGNMWKGNWTGALYLDKRANAKQRQALETIFTGKAGGAPAMLASLVGTNKGLKYVGIDIDPKKIKVSVPGVAEYQLKPTEGGNKKKPIQIANNPFAPAIEPMNMGVSVKSHFSDYGIEFDNTGKDGNFAPFKFKGP